MANSDNKNDKITDADILRESEERYRTLIEKSPDAHLIIDDGGHYVDCNQAALDLLGMASREQLLGLHPADLSPERQPDGSFSLEKSEATIAEILAKGKLRFEWMHRKADGELFFADVVATVIKYHGNALLHSVWRDITENKRMKDDLHKLNEELEKKVSERTAELKKTISQLEETNRAFVDRELRMRELKERIAELEEKEK